VGAPLTERHRFFDAMGLCRRHVLTNELAWDSLTTSRTRQPNPCQHMHSENPNGTQAAHTVKIPGQFSTQINNLVLDNYATHKTSEVKTWLEKHTRFKLHFTTTSASWMNLVERFFAEITTKRIRRGSYSSVDELEAVIYDYLLQHNAKPKPFVWSKTAEDILTRERRALNELDHIRGNR